MHERNCNFCTKKNERGKKSASHCDFDVDFMLSTSVLIKNKNFWFTTPWKVEAFESFATDDDLSTFRMRKCHNFSKNKFSRDGRETHMICLWWFCQRKMNSNECVWGKQECMSTREKEKKSDYDSEKLSVILLNFETQLESKI